MRCVENFVTVCRKFLLFRCMLHTPRSLRSAWRLWQTGVGKRNVSDNLSENSRCYIFVFLTEQVSWLHLDLCGFYVNAGYSWVQTSGYLTLHARTGAKDTTIQNVIGRYAVEREVSCWHFRYGCNVYLYTDFDLREVWGTPETKTLRVLVEVFEGVWGVKQNL